MYCLSASAESGGISFWSRVMQGIDPDALVAPGSAEESRSGFPGNSESDLHTYRPNSLITFFPRSCIGYVGDFGVRTCLNGTNPWTHASGFSDCPTSIDPNVSHLMVENDREFTIPNFL